MTKEKDYDTVYINYKRSHLCASSVLHVLRFLLAIMNWWGGRVGGRGGEGAEQRNLADEHM